MEDVGFVTRENVYKELRNNNSSSCLMFLDTQTMQVISN